MTRPRDRREGHDGAEPEEGRLGEEKPEVGDRVGLRVEPVKELRVAEPVQDDHVDALRAPHRRVEDCTKYVAVLPFQVGRRVPSEEVLSGDRRKPHEVAEGRRHVDLPRHLGVAPGTDARSHERERRTRLHHVERPVLTGLDSERIGARAHDEVGGVGAVEERRDPLVCERVGDVLRLEEAAVRVGRPGDPNLFVE